MYDDMGTPKHTPWVVVISDAAPTDEYKEAFALAHQREADGRLATWFIGTPRFSETVALDLTPRVLRLANHDYSEFFKWLAQNTRSSASRTPHHAAGRPAARGARGRGAPHPQCLVRQPLGSHDDPHVLS